MKQTILLLILASFLGLMCSCDELISVDAGPSLGSNEEKSIKEIIGTEYSKLTDGAVDALAGGLETELGGFFMGLNQNQRIELLKGLISRLSDNDPKRNEAYSVLIAVQGACLSLDQKEWEEWLNWVDPKDIFWML